LAEFEKSKSAGNSGVWISATASCACPTNTANQRCKNFLKQRRKDASAEKLLQWRQRNGIFSIVSAVEKIKAAAAGLDPDEQYKLFCWWTESDAFRQRQLAALKRDITTGLSRFGYSG